MAGSLIVFKLDTLGRKVWQYPARVLGRTDESIRLEAFFNRDDMDLGYTVFRRGDRFVETFYSNRWYNVFAVYDRDNGSLKGWYCNICRAAIITDESVRCEDLALDAWISPVGEVLILDEDEFAALPLATGERDLAEQALRDLIDQAKNGLLPR